MKSPLPRHGALQEINWPCTSHVAAEHKLISCSLSLPLRYECRRPVLCLLDCRPAAVSCFLLFFIMMLVGTCFTFVWQWLYVLRFSVWVYPKVLVNETGVNPGLLKRLTGIRLLSAGMFIHWFIHLTRMMVSAYRKPSRGCFYMSFTDSDWIREIKHCWNLDNVAISVSVYRYVIMVCMYICMYVRAWTHAYPP